MPGFSPYASHTNNQAAKTTIKANKARKHLNHQYKLNDYIF
jgi:hypothetical protein